MSVEENKITATKYHELNPDAVDEILAPDFKGQHQGAGGHTWDRESHRQYLTNNKGKMTDTIYEQFGEGDFVCTRLVRQGMTKDGKSYAVDAMHIKTFKDGKIVHIWEYLDRKQIEEQRTS